MLAMGDGEVPGIGSTVVRFASIVAGGHSRIEPPSAYCWLFIGVPLATDDLFNVALAIVQ